MVLHGRGLLRPGEILKKMKKNILKRTMKSDPQFTQKLRPVSRYLRVVVVAIGVGLNGLSTDGFGATDLPLAATSGKGPQIVRPMGRGCHLMFFGESSTAVPLPTTEGGILVPSYLGKPFAPSGEFVLPNPGILSRRPEPPIDSGIEIEPDPHAPTHLLGTTETLPLLLPKSERADGEIFAGGISNAGISNGQDANMRGTTIEIPSGVATTGRDRGQIILPVAQEVARWGQQGQRDFTNLGSPAERLFTTIETLLARSASQMSDADREMAKRFFAQFSSAGREFFLPMRDREIPGSKPGTKDFNLKPFSLPEPLAQVLFGHMVEVLSKEDGRGKPVLGASQFELVLRMLYNAQIFVANLPVEPILPGLTELLASRHDKTRFFARQSLKLHYTKISPQMAEEILQQLRRDFALASDLAQLLFIRYPNLRAQYESQYEADRADLSRLDFEEILGNWERVLNISMNEPNPLAPSIAQPNVGIELEIKLPGGPEQQARAPGDPFWQRTLADFMERGLLAQECARDGDAAEIKTVAGGVPFNEARGRDILQLVARLQADPELVYFASAHLSIGLDGLFKPASEGDSRDHQLKDPQVENLQAESYQQRSRQLRDHLSRFLFEYRKVDDPGGDSQSLPTRVEHSEATLPTQRFDNREYRYILEGARMVDQLRILLALHALPVGAENLLNKFASLMESSPSDILVEIVTNKATMARFLFFVAGETNHRELFPALGRCALANCLPLVNIETVGGLASNSASHLAGWTAEHLIAIIKNHKYNRYVQIRAASLLGGLSAADFNRALRAGLFGPAQDLAVGKIVGPVTASDLILSLEMGLRGEAQKSLARRIEGRVTSDDFILALNSGLDYLGQVQMVTKLSGALTIADYLRFLEAGLDDWGQRALTEKVVSPIEFEDLLHAIKVGLKDREHKVLLKKIDRPLSVDEVIRLAQAGYYELDYRKLMAALAAPVTVGEVIRILQAGLNRWGHRELVSKLVETLSIDDFVHILEAGLQHWGHSELAAKVAGPITVSDFVRSLDVAPLDSYTQTLLALKVRGPLSAEDLQSCMRRSHLNPTARSILERQVKRGWALPFYYLLNWLR